MSEDWVGRFAPPVLAEQARVVERARGLTYVKPRIGPSLQPLGDSVLWNLAEKGIVLAGPAVEDAWSAFQQSEGSWVVRVSYLAERRRQHGDWTIDMAQGTLRAINKLANELGYVEPGRRRPAALPPAAPVSAAAQRAAAAPPKPTPAPPLPPRPSGRLSLLNSGAGGLVRQSPPSRPAPPPRDRSGDSAPPAPRPSPRLPKDGEPAPSAPESSARLGSSGPAPSRASDAASTSDREPGRRSGSNRGSDPGSRPLGSSDPGAGAGAGPAARSVPGGAPGADPGTAPPERRPRPLRPLSAEERTPAPASSEPASPAVPRPRRERPLRAPARIPSDQLADPSPPSSRRASLSPPASAPSDPEGHRFAPARGAAERGLSTTERFGVGAPAERDSERVRVFRRAPAEDGDADRSSSLRARPLRARRVFDASDPDEGPPPASPPAQRQSDPGQVDEVYQVFTSLEADDPITAPVPVVDADEPGEDDPGPSPETEPNSGRDPVRIRARQAGAAEPSAGPASARGRPADENRQAKPGRLKLRRRPPASP